jgi:SAM-dependent methyltransferase
MAVGFLKRLKALGGVAVGPKLAEASKSANFIEAPDITSAAPRDRFLLLARSFGPAASVLEIGTKQAVEGRSTHSKHAFPNVARENYVMADVAPGHDVDIVADLHALPSAWTNNFDAFVANAVFEHLERPWVAAKEVVRVLAPGGLCYVSTHQTFPLHGYPFDYFRFSKEALSLVFADAGLRVIDAAYEHRAQIVAPVAVVPASFHEEWNATWPSYLCVHLFGEKASQPRF